MSVLVSCTNFVTSSEEYTSDWRMA